MADHAPFQESTGFLLSQLGVLATRAWTKVLTDRSLTPHQHGVLLTLRDREPMSLTALSHATLIDPRNMGPVLEPLEGRGLISRVMDPVDRRRRVITLTTGGTAVAHELAAATAAIEDDLLQPLTAAARESLRIHLLALWNHTRPDDG